jgi:hypothetical protein
VICTLTAELRAARNGMKHQQLNGRKNHTIVHAITISPSISPPCTPMQIMQPISHLVPPYQMQSPLSQS